MSKTNEVRLLGVVGKDPEVKNIGESGKVCNFSMACKDGYKAKDGTWKDTVEWINCVAFSYHANAISKHVKKGSAVAIWGKLHTSSWDDKNGGGKRYKVEVNVTDWMFQQGKGGGQSAPASNQDTPSFGGDEDLPY